MELYVRADAGQDGDGSRMRPFRSISEAAAVAEPGDEVLVAPGIYREAVDPVHAGLPDQRIVYRAQKPGTAVITGAEPVKNWEKTGNIWTVRIPDSVFGDYNPYREIVHGDWYWAKTPAHTGEVYLNGRALYEVDSLSKVQNPVRNDESWAPEETVYTWYAQRSQDTGETVLWANFQAHDPNLENAEISVRRNCFYPSREGISYITVSGFVIRQAATGWAPPTAYQEGMIGPHWSKGWIIENCEISDSKCSGISLGKYLQPENENKWTTEYVKDGTQTEREAICQAQREGWTKEKIGSHIIRRCDIHDCGQTGIVGHLGGVFSLIEDNHIHHINNRQNLAGAEIGGIKLHAAIDVVIRRNRIDHCTRGLWLDWQAQGTRVTQNLFHDNVPPEGTKISQGLALGEDIFVEVSHGPTLIDHNLLLSDFACRLSTQGIALVHNLIAGSFTYVGAGTDNGGKKFPTPRYTPYHVPHRTEVAGFMTILHGDARFCNNIFIQKRVREDLKAYTENIHENRLNAYQFICGTLSYEGYPSAKEYYAQFDSGSYERYDSTDRYYDHLPVYAQGNVYYNGARPFSTENDAIINSTDEIHLELKEQENGTIMLQTDLGSHLSKTDTQLISTQVLGKAFEPEQYFENPDGTPILFDRDYYGNHRSFRPVPGPFEHMEERFNVYERHYCMKDSEDVQGAEGTASVNDLEEAAEPAGISDRSSGQELSASVALTGCEQLCMTEDGRDHFVQEIFIRENTAWIHFVGETGIFELDCEYGISHYIGDWTMETEADADIRQTAGGYAIAGCIIALLEILRKKSPRNPEEICLSMSGKTTPILEKNGIILRFTPQHLKFIKDRKFIPAEQAVKTVCRTSAEVVAEILE